MSRQGEFEAYVTLHEINMARREQQADFCTSYLLSAGSQGVVQLEPLAHRVG
jgi:hypothetical protein